MSSPELFEARTRPRVRMRHRRGLRIALGRARARMANEQNAHDQLSALPGSKRKGCSLNLYLNSPEQKRAIAFLAKTYNTSTSRLLWMGYLMIREHGEHFMTPAVEANGWPQMVNGNGG